MRPPGSCESSDDSVLLRRAPKHRNQYATRAVWNQFPFCADSSDNAGIKIKQPETWGSLGPSILGAVLRTALYFYQVSGMSRYPACVTRICGSELGPIQEILYVQTF